MDALETLLGKYIADLASFVGDFIVWLAPFMAYGVFLAVIAFVIGYTVVSVFTWLHSFTD